jgi:hypothetical protein
VTKGAAKAELVAQDRDGEPRSSGTEINFLCVRVFGLSLCGFHLGQKPRQSQRTNEMFFHLCIPTQPLRQFQTSRSVEQKAGGNKSTRVR